MADGNKETVGIVGVGRMGMAMLKHLLTHGHRVVACDRKPEQQEKARAAGASIAKTPAEVGKSTSFVIIGVGYDEEVNAPVLGRDGLLETLKPGSIVAVSATAKPDTVMALDERTREKGVDVLDAPIC